MDAIYYNKSTLFNRANLHTQHAMIVPKWYRYKILPNTLFINNLLNDNNPYFDKQMVCERMIKLYDDLGQHEESKLCEKYKQEKISSLLFFKLLTK